MAVSFRVGVVVAGALRSGATGRGWRFPSGLGVGVAGALRSRSTRRAWRFPSGLVWWLPGRCGLGPLGAHGGFLPGWCGGCRGVAVWGHWAGMAVSVGVGCGGSRRVAV